MQITMIGIDLAKNVFEVHGADERGKPVLRKQIRAELRRQLDSTGPRFVKALNRPSQKVGVGVSYPTNRRISAFLIGSRTTRPLDKVAFIFDAL